MEDISAKFHAIRGYFTNDSWNQLSDYERQVFCNMKANYDKMSELGKNDSFITFKMYSHAKSNLNLNSLLGYC